MTRVFSYIFCPTFNSYDHSYNDKSAIIQILVLIGTHSVSARQTKVTVFPW